MSNLNVKDLCYDIDNLAILKDININVQEGEFVGLVGPNGCGKSTLLKNIYRVYKPCAGYISIDEEDLLKLSNKETAKKMAVVFQENNLNFDFKVIDMVLMGRYAHKSLLDKYNDDDFDLAEQALLKVGMDEFSQRNFLSLSGGEKQRVLIARALVQEAKLLILDEPTNHLDIGYQLQIMDIIKNQKITTFSAIHDINIAAFYCDKIITMYDGEVFSFGTPEQVINEEMLNKLFRVKADIKTNEITGKLTVTYIPNSSL